MKNLIVLLYVSALFVVPRISAAAEVRSCKVINGIGVQDNHGGIWSDCGVKECNAGFGNYLGTCQVKPKSTGEACGVFGGKGEILVLIDGSRLCSVQSCDTGFVEVANSCVLEGAPKALVNLVVVRKSDGTGNEKWNNTYIHRMMTQMTSQTVGNVRFVLGTVKYWKNTADYQADEQDDIKNKFRNFRKFGVITAVATQHGTTDSAGTALGIKYNYEPLMMIRSRENDGSAKDSGIAAAILLHELGHNMGMKHNYDKKVNMDNHYKFTPQVLVNYVKGLNSCATPTDLCKSRYSKFSTSKPKPKSFKFF